MNLSLSSGFGAYLSFSRFDLEMHSTLLNSAQLNIQYMYSSSAELVQWDVSNFLQFQQVWDGVYSLDSNTKPFA